MIIVDTREQLPLWSKGVTKKKLIVGDYTTPILQKSFIIERKSPSDLYQTITRGHVRFRKELYRAMLNEIELALYVECSASYFYDLKFVKGFTPKVKGETLKKTINTISRKYNLKVYWCKNRADMKKKITAHFKKLEGSITRPH